MIEPTSLTRNELTRALARWYKAWNAHDLDAVMSLLHESVRFEHWDGTQVLGKPALRRAWSAWFSGSDFRFDEEETFIDEREQKVLFRWRLSWPSPLAERRGEPEKRRGVDVLHFQDRLIIRKLTYCKTTVTIAGRPLSLKAAPASP